MNDREVAQEVIADFPNARRYGENVLLNRARRIMIKKKVWTASFKYVSPRRNTWLINVRRTNEFKWSQEIRWGCLRMGTRGYGLLVPCVANKGEGDSALVTYFTAHLFSRMNERLGLGFVNPLDIVKWAWKQDFDGFIDTSPNLSGIKSRDMDNPIHLCSDIGVSMGYYNGDILVLRTFIPYEMCNVKQLSKFGRLKDKIHTVPKICLDEVFDKI